MTGIMLSEESGEHEGIRNSGAVEYVSDISQRGGGTFEVNNHARRRALQQQRQPRRLAGCDGAAKVLGFWFRWSSGQTGEGVQKVQVTKPLAAIS